MDTDDDLFLDAVEALLIDVPERIGDSPKARFAFFRGLVDRAQEVVGHPEGAST